MRARARPARASTTATAIRRRWAVPHRRPTAPHVRRVGCARATTAMRRRGDAATRRRTCARRRRRASELRTPPLVPATCRRGHAHVLAAVVQPGPERDQREWPEHETHEEADHASDPWVAPGVLMNGRGAERADHGVHELPQRPGNHAWTIFSSACQINGYGPGAASSHSRGARPADLAAREGSLARDGCASGLPRGPHRSGANRRTSGSGAGHRFGPAGNVQYR